MAISSISRIYDAPDPVMETDLELLAKVNTYEQEKFDRGGAALQNEVNNWAMMAQIAKPELKQYANQKLNNLVSGINNLGGVNLSDINNVNSLKALGYNIYGDQRIVDGMVTTQKMKALATSIQTNLSGKDAAKYDPSVGQYLMDGYNKWANDGDVNNTKYDGPTALPMGNMNTINAKVLAYLKELKPDSDSMPRGDLQKSYDYFQIEGKWLKGNRIQEAINAVTDENDSLIFRAHGWKTLNSDTDIGLISKMGLVYDNAATSIKDQIQYLNAELNLPSNAGKTQQFTELIAEQKQYLAKNESEKAEWYNKKQLSSAEREGIQQSLYQNAWKSNVVNSYSYGQEKKELKSNMPLIFHDRMQMQANQWAADYQMKGAELQLKQQELLLKQKEFELKASLGISLNGGSDLPLNQESNTGKNNQEKSPEAFIDQINAQYFGKNAGYYQYLYNILGANDTKGRFVNVNNLWKPKPEYKGQIEKELSLFTSKLDNYSNLTDEEKKNLNLAVSEDELNDLFNIRNQVNTYGVYKQMAEDKEGEILKHAMASGAVPFDWRNVPITVDGKETTVTEALALYEAKVYNDNSKVDIKGSSDVSMDISGGGFSSGGRLMKLYKDKLNVTSLKDLKNSVNDMRKAAATSYSKIAGRMFNSYSVPIPFDSQPKQFQEVAQKQLFSIMPVGSADVKSINPIKGYIELNFATGKPEYKVDVQVGSTDKTRGTVQGVDVTKAVEESPNSGIAAYFPKSDVALIWGLELSNSGSTPFSKQDNYRKSLRIRAGNYPFQISKMPNSLNGTSGLKVKIAVPIGDGKTVEVNVKNEQNGSYTFPSGIEFVERYLNTIFSDPSLKAEFYKKYVPTLK